MLAVTIASLLGVYLGLTISFHLYWNLTCIILLMLWVKRLLERLWIVCWVLYGCYVSLAYNVERRQLDSHPVIQGQVIQHFNEYLVLDSVSINGRATSFKIAVISKAHADLNDLCEIHRYTLRFHQRSQPNSKVSTHFQRKILATVRSRDLQCHASNGLIDRVRYSVIQRVKSYSYEGVMRALLLGDTSVLTKQHKQTFQAAGTSHLMAVSGLHLGVVGWLSNSFAKSVFRWFGVRPLSSLRWANAWTLIVLWCYGLLTGWSASTSRSYAMIYLASALVILAMPVNRRDIFYMAIAALIMMEPWYVMDCGFWLSIIAVEILLRLKSTRYFLSSFYQSLKLCTLMAPMSSYLSGYFSIHSIAMNTFLIPLYSILIFPGLLLWTIVGFFIDVSYLGVWLNELIRLSVSVMVLMNQHGFFVYVAELSLFQLVYVQGAIITYAWNRVMCFQWLILGALLSLVCLFLEGVSYGQARITMLDVGHGLSVVVQTQRHCLLYDLGPKFGKYSLGDHVVSSMKHLGIKTVDAWILSHPDQDHIGGLKEVLQVYRPQWVLSGVPKDTPIASSQCQAGSSWEWDGVRFQIIHPKTAWRKRNNNSCVLLIQSKSQSALLTGDIEYNAENSLLDQLSPVTLLQVPHHGSLTSSSEEFLKRLQPKVAWVSVGEGNPVIPHPKVLSRYSKLNIPIRTTSQQGWLSQVLK